MSDLDLRAQAADLEQITTGLRFVMRCEGVGCGEANPIGIADAALAAVERVKARLLGIAPRDWPAFWQSLTDADAAACLRAAPRVAGEWDAQSPSVSARWNEAVAHRVALVARRRGGDWIVMRPILDEIRSYPSEAEARAACDSALRASGWRVLDGDKKVCVEGAHAAR